MCYCNTNFKNMKKCFIVLLVALVPCICFSQQAQDGSRLYIHTTKFAEYKTGDHYRYDAMNRKILIFSMYPDDSEGVSCAATLYDRDAVGNIIYTAELSFIRDKKDKTLFYLNGTWDIKSFKDIIQKLLDRLDNKK